MHRCERIGRRTLRRGIGHRFIGIGHRTRCALATAGGEGIGQLRHEDVHDIERGLLAAGGEFAGDLRQALCIQRAESQRYAAGAIEEIGQRTADIGLIAAQTTGHAEAERQVEIDIVGVIAQRCAETRRQIGVHHRSERRATESTGRIQNGVLPGDVTARREFRLDRRAA